MNFLDSQNLYQGKVCTGDCQILSCHSHNETFSLSKAQQPYAGKKKVYKIWVQVQKKKGIAEDGT
jgi:hypothetical protein